MNICNSFGMYETDSYLAISLKFDVRKLPFDDLKNWKNEWNQALTKSKTNIIFKKKSKLCVYIVRSASWKSIYFVQLCTYTLTSKNILYIYVHCTQ